MAQPTQPLLNVSNIAVNTHWTLAGGPPGSIYPLALLFGTLATGEIFKFPFNARVLAASMTASLISTGTVSSASGNPAPYQAVTGIFLHRVVGINSAQGPSIVINQTTEILAKALAGNGLTTTLVDGLAFDESVAPFFSQGEQIGFYLMGTGVVQTSDVFWTACASIVWHRDYDRR